MRRFFVFTNLLVQAFCVCLAQPEELIKLDVWDVYL